MIDTVILDDCIKTMQAMEQGSVDLGFADPPFNIGLEYDVYEDLRPYHEYVEWTDAWVKEMVRVLKPNGSLYVAIGDEFAAEINLALKKAGLYFRNWIVWHYTFGQNTRSKFARCHTHILYFTKSKTDFIFNKDEVLVPSNRQLIYKDKRAKAGGKVPDDVWPVYTDNPAHEKSLRVWPEEFEVWGDSRVCGTFKQRIVGHPCQLPESLLERIIRASSMENALVFDPFCGTGTTAHVAKKLNRHFITCDMSEDYCKAAANRIFGDPLRYSSHL